MEIGVLPTPPALKTKPRERKRYGGSEKLNAPGIIATPATPVEPDSLLSRKNVFMETKQAEENGTKLSSRPPGLRLHEIPPAIPPEEEVLDVNQLKMVTSVDNLIDEEVIGSYPGRVNDTDKELETWKLEYGKRTGGSFVAKHSEDAEQSAKIAKKTNKSRSRALLRFRSAANKIVNRVQKRKDTRTYFFQLLFIVAVTTAIAIVLSLYYYMPLKGRTSISILTFYFQEFLVLTYPAWYCYGHFHYGVFATIVLLLTVGLCAVELPLRFWGPSAEFSYIVGNALNALVPYIVIPTILLYTYMKIEEKTKTLQHEESTPVEVCDWTTEEVQRPAAPPPSEVSAISEDLTSTTSEYRTGAEAVSVENANKRRRNSTSQRISVQPPKMEKEVSHAASIRSILSSPERGVSKKLSAASARSTASTSNTSRSIFGRIFGSPKHAQLQTIQKDALVIVKLRGFLRRFTTRLRKKKKIRKLVIVIAVFEVLTAFAFQLLRYISGVNFTGFIFVFIVPIIIVIYVDSVKDETEVRREAQAEDSRSWSYLLLYIVNMPAPTFFGDFFSLGFQLFPSYRVLVYIGFGIISTLYSSIMKRIGRFIVDNQNYVIFLIFPFMCENMYNHWNMLVLSLSDWQLWAILLFQSIRNFFVYGDLGYLAAKLLPEVADWCHCFRRCSQSLLEDQERRNRFKSYVANQFRKAHAFFVSEIVSVLCIPVLVNMHLVTHHTSSISVSVDKSYYVSSLASIWLKFMLILLFRTFIQSLIMSIYISTSPFFTPSKTNSTSKARESELYSIFKASDQHKKSFNTETVVELVEEQEENTADSELIEAPNEHEEQKVDNYANERNNTHNRNSSIPHMSSDTLRTTFQVFSRIYFSSRLFFQKIIVNWYSVDLIWYSVCCGVYASYAIFNFLPGPTRIVFAQ